MLTNQQSYTVSDELDRGSPESPIEATENNSPCHQLLDWEDDLEERPIVFRIREYTNCEENSATVSFLMYQFMFIQYYTIEVCTSNFAPYGSWSVSRRYSEFR